MYMLNMVIILIIMYCNVVTAIDKIPTYLLRFNMAVHFPAHSIFFLIMFIWNSTEYKTSHGTSYL